MNATGAILAGGASSRMGQAKALIEWSGRPLIQEVRDRLLTVVPDILVVTGVPEMLPFLDVPMVPDVFPGRGPLGGLHAALSHTGSEWVLLVGCDQPFLSVGLMSHILSHAQTMDADAVVPALGDGKIEPLCAAYSRGILPGLTDWLERGGSSRFLRFLSEISVKYLEPDEWGAFGPPERLFFNINTRADLERARLMADGKDQRCQGQ